MPNTPVPESHRLTWSHSALEMYKNCPLNYWANKVAKLVPFEQGDAAKWGDQVHIALEKRCRDGEVLPSNMSMYEPVAQKVLSLAEGAAHVGYEEAWCIDSSFKPVEYFSKSAWARCKADVFILREDNTATVIDYKTGKYRGPTPQGPINALMAFCMYPEITSVEVDFWYLRAGKRDNTVFNKTDAASLYAPVKKQLEDVSWSITNQNFPAKPSGLCGKYCGYLACPHNGRNTV